MPRTHLSPHGKRYALHVERTEEALQLVLGAVKLQTKDKLD